MDAAGALYGLTDQGGPGHYGVAYKLSATAEGGWKETVIQTFGDNTGYGLGPKLAVDPAGNLYGTAASGGPNRGGTVFELTPPKGSGTLWKLTLIDSFTLNSYGPYYPQSDLVLDASGNLYGTSTAGGAYGGGTVFKLTPAADGSWIESLLYSFCKVGTNCEDGYFSNAGLSFDADGNLYGTTLLGGAYNHGVVYELSLSAGGNWSETVLYSFCPSQGQCLDGSGPDSNVVMDSVGNLYGVTDAGGPQRNGVVFELTRSGQSWTENTIYSLHTLFLEDRAGLIIDAAGNLYGTNDIGDGLIYELSPASGGGWSEQTLFRFHGSDGREPEGSLLMDSVGNLFGITTIGGTNNMGTIFELTP